MQIVMRIWIWVLLLASIVVSGAVRQERMEAVEKIYQKKGIAREMSYTNE